MARASKESRFRASFVRCDEKRLAAALKRPPLAMQDASYGWDRTQNRQKVTPSVTPPSRSYTKGIDRIDARFSRGHGAGDVPDVEGVIQLTE